MPWSAGSSEGRRWRAATFAALIATLAVMWLLGAGPAPPAAAQQPPQPTPGVTGVGVFPAVLDVAQARRGERYEAGTVLLNASTSERRFRFEPVVERGGIDSWISFATAAEPTTLVREAVAPPRGEIHLLVYVTIPKNAAAQDYRGVINYFSTATSGEPDVPLPIRQELRLKVSGQQTLDLQVGEVQANTLEVGQTLVVTARIVNRSNVDVTPTVLASIRTAAGVEVARDLTSRLELLRPNEERTLTIVEWEAKGQQPGDYVLAYRVLVQGAEFGVGTVPFALASVGELSRSGEILGISLSGSLAPGSLGQGKVRFRNTGSIDARARFEGWLFRDDRELMPVRSRTEVLARPREEVELDVFFPVERSGRHELRGRVLFAGTQTDEFAISFGGRVESPPDASSGPLEVAIGGLVLALMLLVAVALGMLRRRLAHT